MAIVYCSFILFCCPKLEHPSTTLLVTVVTFNKLLQKSWIVFIITTTVSYYNQAHNLARYEQEGLFGVAVCHPFPYFILLCRFSHLIFVSSIEELEKMGKTYQYAMLPICHSYLGTKEQV